MKYIILCGKKYSGRKTIAKELENRGIGRVLPADLTECKSVNLGKSEVGIIVLNIDEAKKLLQEEGYENCQVFFIDAGDTIRKSRGEKIEGFDTQEWVKLRRLEDEEYTDINMAGMDVCTINISGSRLELNVEKIKQVVDSKRDKFGFYFEARRFNIDNFKITKNGYTIELTRDEAFALADQLGVVVFSEEISFCDSYR